ncbi:hypothetical protein BFP97_11185 [Roseivirga sp. 4D4]|uniref:lysophospholipid acyltransferase family protein n=1 Tax=Roseivirga sp. 4D4 TaxID=1889784 RepID=UPI0008535ECB|nr:lysophospholipid acyltransferase family protein [Roseivirga sp. 4D4]OEK02050.1 hypothetical protein BFP97_11185 [Roseivirga sp. 4D4]
MYLVRILSRLPFWFLYPFAEATAFLGYHVLKYRKAVVQENLSKAFPEKSENDLRRIAKRFYRQFSQVFVESIKAYRFTKEDWAKRVPITNLNEVRAFLDKGVPVILMSGHAANWEWPAFSIGAQMEYPMEFLYKPVQNQKFEKIMLQLRTRHGGIAVPKDAAVREIIKRRKQPRLVGIIADQLPSIGTEKLWLDFLNRETAFYVGAERIASMAQYAVFYVDAVRTGLGKYELTCKNLATPPYAKGEPLGIIEKYKDLLEVTIQKNPSDYLWSHRRWKYTKEEEEAVLASSK